MFKFINKKAVCFMMAASMMFSIESMPMQSKAAEASKKTLTATVSTGAAISATGSAVSTTGAAVTTDSTDQKENEKPSKNKTDKKDTKKKESIYKDKALVVSGKDITVYKKASKKSKKVGQMNKGDMATVYKKKNGWLKITSGKVSGYVKKKYFAIGDQISSKKEKKYGKKYTTKNGNKRYKFSKAITWKQVLKKIEQKKIKKGKAVVDYAKKFVGNRYVYGGTSLTHGTDCSGFSMRIYQKFGKSLPRTSREQSRVGKRVSRSKLQPGDLLFFKHGSRIGHVAIYAGNGKIVHAACRRLGIITSNLGHRRVAVARRII